MVPSPMFTQKSVVNGRILVIDFKHLRKHKQTQDIRIELAYM